MKKFIVRKGERKNYIQVTCRFEEKLLDQINETVLKYDIVSRNNFINECIRFALENMKIEE